MDRYRVAPATALHGAHSPRPLFVGAGRHLQPQAAAGRRSGGGELDIFAAERYFNAADVVSKNNGADDVAVDRPPAPVLPADETPPVAAAAQAAVDTASQSGRTAASSEASWNSRSGLLSSYCQSAAAGRQKGYGGGGNGAAAASDRCHRGGGKRRWGLFRRDCPCAGRKAVTVDVASEPKSPTTPRIHARFSGDDAREEFTIFKEKEAPPPTPTPIGEPAKMKITPGSHAFPHTGNNIFVAAAEAPPPARNGAGASFSAFSPDIGRRVVSSGGFTFPVLGPGKAAIGTVEEPPRESLEVFRPIDEDSVVLADPPPALAMPRGGHGRAPPPPPAAAAMEEDAMSDTSSDLFDLESFAASSSYPTTYHGRSSRRNSGEDDLAFAAAAEPALSECMYAPSEASVVWSVVTAEGGAFDAASVANFSSAASACCVDELRFLPPLPAAGDDGFTAAMSRSAGRKKGGGGFLNSCRCEKAVSVGPTPVRVVRPPPPVKNGGGHTHHGAGFGSGGAARYHTGRVHVAVQV